MNCSTLRNLCLWRLTEKWVHSLFCVCLNRIGRNCSVKTQLTRLSSDVDGFDRCCVCVFRQCFKRSSTRLLRFSKPASHVANCLKQIVQTPKRHFFGAKSVDFRSRLGQFKTFLISSRILRILNGLTFPIGHKGSISMHIILWRSWISSSSSPQLSYSLGHSIVLWAWKCKKKNNND